MKPGVSIVICCHNSAKRLPETLGHLAAQKVQSDLSWEVLLIDNGSSDETADVAARCWPKTSPAPLRVVREPKLGIGNARLRSFSEAQYDIISFVDDDNWVGHDWVQNVNDFFKRNPDASAVGGPSRAVFERPPPEWFSSVSMFYAIGDQHSFAGDITDQPGTLLRAAGMSLRKEKALGLIGDGFRFFSCGGSSLQIKTGEDTELCFALRASGGRLHYDPKLVIEHFMPADRLIWSKALGLIRTMGTSSVLLDLYMIALDVPPFADRPAWKKSWLFYTLKALQRIFMIFVTHPLDCLWQPEGSVPALDFKMKVGQIATLRSLFGRYNKTRDIIRYSEWAKR